MRFLVKTLVLAALLAALVQNAAAQTADELVEKYLNAIGGRAALGKIKSRYSVGTITISSPVGDLTGPVEVWNQAPNKSRNLIKLDLTAVGVGQVVIDQRFDGETGYVIDSLQGNRDITGGQLDLMKNASFPSPFLNYKEMGMTAEITGKEKVGDRECYVLVGKPKVGPSVRSYIDADSYLIIRTVVKVEVPQIGGELEQTSDLSDYRDVDGMKIPFQVKNSSAVQTLTITITKVQQNTDIEPTVFSKP